MKAATLGIGGRQLGEGQPCLVVAHVETFHEGDKDVALRLIDAAFQAGADAIAFAVFRASELVARRHPERHELEAAELAPHEWRKVLEAAKASGLLVVAEAFDTASRDLAAEAGVDAFQTHPTDLDHLDLVRALAASGRPLLLGAGAGDDTLVRAALAAAGASVALVLGPLAAPAAPEELRLADLAARRERHRVPVGLFDTTDGASAFALVAPALAAAHGADLVEKRLLLDRSRKGRDAAAALAPQEFYRMVELLRQAERARGDAFGQEAASTRARARGRSIVAASLIGRGDVLTAERLLFKRTDERFGRGLSPAEAHRVIGRRAARPIQADETIKEDMLE
jgi:N-acetylneuraminate synthase/N,N'-diacetyllegionaminate synthase